MAERTVFIVYGFANIEYACLRFLMKPMEKIVRQIHSGEARSVSLGEVISLK